MDISHSGDIHVIMEVLPLKLTTNFKIDNCPLSPINILIGCRDQCSRHWTVILNGHLKEKSYRKLKQVVSYGLNNEKFNIAQ
jgi:hypothetical protein